MRLNSSTNEIIKNQSFKFVERHAKNEIEHHILIDIKHKINGNRKITLQNNFVNDCGIKIFSIWRINDSPNILWIFLEDVHSDFFLAE